jgi:DNA-binding MarR family transcriptional regulator
MNKYESIDQLKQEEEQGLGDLELAREMIETLPRIMRWIRMEMRKFAKPELTIAQLKILTKLFQEPKTMSELAENQGVSPPAISKMIAALEKREFVERVSFGTDRRMVYAQLTAKGRSVYKNIQNQVQKMIERRLSKMEVSKKRRIYLTLFYLRDFYE